MKTKNILLLPLTLLVLAPGCVSKETRQAREDWALIDAVAADDVATVAKFLRKVSPDYSPFGEDPLITRAAEGEAIGVMELLLREGADKERRTVCDGLPNLRPLELYLLVKETNVNERIVALLQRDKPNTPQEDVEELIEVTLLSTFLRSPPFDPFRLSVSGFSPDVDMTELTRVLIWKGYPISRDGQDSVGDLIEIVFDKTDENTYTIETSKNKNISLGSSFAKGKLEKRYGYWMYTWIDYWISW